MGVREKEICCCGSSKWIKVFGWMQIVIGVLGIIGLIDKLGKYGANDYAIIQGVTMVPTSQVDLDMPSLLIILISVLTNIILGGVLLTANNMANICYLRAWFIVGVLAPGIFICIGELQKTAEGRMTAGTCVAHLLILSFIVAIPTYVIHRRCVEIRSATSDCIDKVYLVSAA